FLVKTVRAEDAAGCMVHSGSADTRTDGSECGRAGLKNGAVDLLVAKVGHAQQVGTCNVRPVAVSVGVAVDQRQIAGLDFSGTRKSVSAGGFRRVGARHAEGKTIGAHHPISSRAPSQASAEEGSGLDLAHAGIEPGSAPSEGLLRQGAGGANPVHFIWSLEHGPDRQQGVGADQSRRRQGFNQQLHDGGAIQVHSNIAGGFGSGSMFVTDARVSNPDCLGAPPQGLERGFAGGLQLVQAAGPESVDFVRPASASQFLLVFRNNQADTAFAGGDGDAVADYRPVAGEQQDIVGQGAKHGVQLHSLQAAADPVNSV